MPEANCTFCLDLSTVPSWTSGNSYVLASDAWNTWTTTTTSAAAEASWLRWLGAAAGAVGTTMRQEGEPVRLSPPSLAPSPEAVRRVQEERRAAEERRLERQAAALRAEKLLLRQLTRQQRADRRRDGWFAVTGSAGRRYRIMEDVSGNVRQMVKAAGEWRAIARLCCHPLGVPTPDVHLAQLLWLTHDEETFRRVANITPYAGYHEYEQARR